MNSTMIVGRGSDVFSEVVQAINELPGTTIISPSSGEVYRIVKILQFQIIETVQEDKPYWNIFALVELAQDADVDHAAQIVAMMHEEPVSVEEG